MNTTQPERRIHISELCARVFRQHEQECGTPPGASEATKNIGAARRNYFGDESQTDSNFDDAAAEAEWLSKWSHQQPDIHLDSIAPDDGVYEGFDDRARPIDSVPAYLAERSGISYQDAVDYIHRARFGCQWGKLKRASDDVWPDITAIARIVSAYFQGDAMRELIAWFVKEYPHEATEMGLPDSDVEQSLRGAGRPGEPNEDQTDAGDVSVDLAGVESEKKDPDNEWPPNDGLHFRPLDFAYQGKVYRLTGMPRRLFEVIATAKKNLHYSEIVEKVWTSQDRSPERSTVRACLSNLKAALRTYDLGDLANRIEVKDEYWSFLG